MNDDYSLRLDYAGVQSTAAQGVQADGDAMLVKGIPWDPSTSTKTPLLFWKRAHYMIKC
jgi:hypothetical protein